MLPTAAHRRSPPRLPPPSGLLGYVDTVKVTLFFTWYIVADFTWILVEPSAVPSLPNIILLHHVVTFILLCFPLRYPALGTFTCWDGICEINTFFLIARRQWRTGRGALTFLFWATFFPLRIFLYPLMLVRMYQQMQPYATWEMLTVCACQTLLIAFNVVLLVLSVSNWKKRAGKGGKGGKKGAAVVQEAVAVPKSGVRRQQITAKAVAAAPARG